MLTTIPFCLQSPFLDLLFKYQCIRTQKKQKVFYWYAVLHPSPCSDPYTHVFHYSRFSVPHDRLFLDALERDLKREKMGQESTTEVIGEPARSFTYDPKRSLYDQFSKAQGAMEGEGELEAAVRKADEAMNTESPDGHADSSKESDAEGTASELDESGAEDGKKDGSKKPNALASSPFFSSMFSLFEGSPTYKQRRKKVMHPRATLIRSRQPTEKPTTKSKVLWAWSAFWSPQDLYAFLTSGSLQRSSCVPPVS